MDELTARQTQTLDAIASLTLEAGYPPTIRELAKAIGLTSPNGALTHVRALARRGLVTWNPRQGRTLRVVMTP